MAANPPLVSAQGFQGLFPSPYAGEYIALGREGMQFEISGVRTASGKWSAKGMLFLTNMRLVVVAPKPDKSGLQAFELPYAYIYSEKFSQPIFGSNNLAGECKMVEDATQSIKFALYFKEGGFGTAIPLFMRFLEYVRVAQRNLVQQYAAAQAAAQAPPPPPVASAPQEFLQTALVDPNDPSVLYLTQPVDASQQRPDQPKFNLPLV